MERIVNLHIERLPEGMYLATSADIQGLVAQRRTIQETLEVARDVARKLIEARTEREGVPPLMPTADVSEYPLFVNA
jgi:predicted RNase H-like HicB family nuclease